MKKIGLILILFVLCGCTANSEVTISRNKVIEKVIVKEEKSKIEVNDDDYDSMINSYRDLYGFDNINYEYKVSNINDDKFVGVMATRQYENICDYVNNSYFINYSLSTIKCESDDNYILSGSVNYFSGEEEAMEGNSLSEIKAVFKLNKKAISNNADKIEGNVYTWDFREGQGEKTVQLEFKQNKIMSIIEANTKKSKNIIIVIILAISVLLLSLIFGFYLKYKRNKMSL